MAKIDIDDMTDAQKAELIRFFNEQIALHPGETIDLKPWDVLTATEYELPKIEVAPDLKVCFDGDEYTAAVGDNVISRASLNEVIDFVVDVNKGDLSRYFEGTRLFPQDIEHADLIDFFVLLKHHVDKQQKRAAEKMFKKPVPWKKAKPQIFTGRPWWMDFRIEGEDDEKRARDFMKNLPDAPFNPMASSDAVAHRDGAKLPKRIVCRKAARQAFVATRESREPMVKVDEKELADFFKRLDGLEDA